MIKSYKDLEVWKKGIEIVDFVYELTEGFPKNEKFGLASQMQRAAVSIPTNVAEGASRGHTKEYVHFCYVALGSCAELETESVIALRREYIQQREADELAVMLDEEGKMLRGLVRSLLSH